MNLELVSTLWNLICAVINLYLAVFGAIQIYRGKTVEGLLWIILAGVYGIRTKK